MNTTEQYYVLDETTNEALGPYYVAELRTMVRQRRVDETAQVCAEGGDRWVPFHDVPALTAPDAGQRLRHAHAVAMAGLGGGHFGSTRTRGVYIILALFLGSLGVHNFYAGRINHGFLQLGLLLFGALVHPLLVLVPGVLALVECFTVRHDGDGEPMQ